MERERQFGLEIGPGLGGAGSTAEQVAQAAEATGSTEQISQVVDRDVLGTPACRSSGEASPKVVCPE